MTYLFGLKQCLSYLCLMAVTAILPLYHAMHLCPFLWEKCEVKLLFLILSHFNLYCYDESLSA